MMHSRVGVTNLGDLGERGLFALLAVFFLLLAFCFSLHMSAHKCRGTEAYCVLV